MWSETTCSWRTTGQYLPTHIRQGRVTDSTRLTQSVRESAIGLHLVNNSGCVLKYSDEAFRVLHKAQSVKHLRFLETDHIFIDRHWACRRKTFFILCV